MSPSTTAPGTRQKVSQMEAVRPSSVAAPSIWYAAVAAPHRNPAGKARSAAGPAVGRVLRSVIP